MIRFLAAFALAGCGVASTALRLSHLPFGEHVPDAETASGLDHAPASHALVDWSGGAIRCGRITDIHVTSTTYTFTPVTKFMMLFLGGLGEGLAGTLMVALPASDRGTRIGGAFVLGDAALAVAGALLWDQRAEIEHRDRYGLAYQCNPGDGIAIGERVAPVTKQGALSADDLAALRAELAEGKPLRLVVDRKVVGVPQTSTNVLVTLTRVPAIVPLPLLGAH